MTIDSDFNLVHLIILSLASWRATRLIIEDRILEPVRNRIWEKHHPDASFWGYLITCYWCLGLWVSAFVVGWYLILPSVSIPVAAIFALSALVGLIDHKISNY